MDYNQYKTTELRSMLSQKLRDGEIAESGTRPHNPSRVFRLTSKALAVEWLTSKRITWGTYKSDGSIYSESADSASGDGTRDGDATESKTDATQDGNDADTDDDTPEAQEDTQSEDGESSDAPEDQVKQEMRDMFFEQNGSEGGRSFVTTSGTLTSKEVDDTLQINQRLEKLADFTGYALHKQDKTAKAVVQLQNRINSISENGAGGGEVIIKINDKEVKRTDRVHYHPKFEKLTNYAKWYGNVMLVGEAGTGKTTVAQMVADSLSLQFRHLSCSAGMSEAHLLGRMVFDGSYVQSDFVDVYENGGVFLFDEFDAMDGNCAVVINSALANGTMSVPNRKDNPTAIRHKDCIIIVACNTFGTGYGDRKYAGRNKLDGATLDRFCSSKIYFDYDKKLESMLCGDFDKLKLALWALRKEVNFYKLDKIVSTRLFLNGNKAMSNGESPRDFLETVTIDWTDEEKSKVNIDGIIAIAEGK